MKKITLIAALVLGTNVVFGQYQIDTSFYSEALGMNKMVDIYIPPGYDQNPGMCFPVIYYLHGYGGESSLGGLVNQFQTMIYDSVINPAIIVCADNSPDPFGGSCYMNSPLWGNYENFMINDLIGWIDGSFRTIPERGGRALLGPSMGGTGALRYGILHKDKFCALASHAGLNNLQDSTFREETRLAVLTENQGPPYSYTFSLTKVKTLISFLFCGIGSPAPDTNWLQPYVNPPLVYFYLDENGNYIDSLLTKQAPYDNAFLISTLHPSDSVGILLGCATNDWYSIYPGHLALLDSLEKYGLPYEFYSHNLGHPWPTGFKYRAFEFLDSLLISPYVFTTTAEQHSNQISCKVSPNPFNWKTAISYEIRVEYNYLLEIWNHLGNLIQIVSEGRKVPGEYRELFDGNDLPAGLYFCRLQIGNEVVIKKIIKVH